jgi:hypothetical protein
LEQINKINSEIQKEEEEKFSNHQNGIVENDQNQGMKKLSKNQKKK